MVHHMIKGCPPVILSSGIKEKMLPEPHENTGSIYKITTHLFTLILYHILCLSAKFKGRVNHKLDLWLRWMQHLHPTLSSWPLCNLHGESTAPPSSNRWNTSDPILHQSNHTQPSPGNQNDVTELGGYQPAYIHRAVKSCRDSLVRKAGII